MDAKSANPAEITKWHRECWDPSCSRKARLEWCGWRYCLRHFWRHVLAGQASWAHLWVKLRFTEIARHRR